MTDENIEGSGVGPAPPETVQLWRDVVRSMGPDELADFERRTFAQWDRACLGACGGRSSGGDASQGLGGRPPTS